MALWGISTTTETAENNYGIPKHLKDTDKTHTPHNCFADERGWIYRIYKDGEHSGLSTDYYDEVLVPVAGLNTTGIGSNTTGLGAATPVAVFFADPNNASIISVGGGATTGIGTGDIGYVHVVWNESVYAGAGATVRLRTLDANGLNPSTPIVATATSATPGVKLPIFANAGIGYTYIENYNGQISNRIAFRFTAPSTVLSANVVSNTTSVNATVSSGSTTIFVADTTGVQAGISSISVVGVAITNRPVVSVGATFVRIGTASTVSGVIGIGTVVTFSSVVNETKLAVDMAAGVVGTVTDFAGGSATKAFTSDIIRNIAGAGSTSGVGIGVTTLSVTA